MTSELPIPLVHPAWWAVCEEFLTANELAFVMQTAFSDPSAYRPSGVMNNSGGGVNPEYRRSSVRFDEPSLTVLFQERLLACCDSIFERLRVRPFPVKNLEIQLTSTGNGEYFRVHNDNTHEVLRSRRITFVYYFFIEPKMYRGGELRLFASRTDGMHWSETDHFVDLEPRQNALVVFPSFLMHEVRPVSVSTDDFRNRRFTVNGWFHG